MAAPPSAASPTREATVRDDVVAEVLAVLRGGATRVALQGLAEPSRPATLRILVERLRPAFRPALIPYPALPPAEVAAWALGLLDEGLCGDPERRLLEVAARGPGPVVLVLDDAEALPVATARRLDGLLTEAGAGLRLVGVLDAHPRAQRVLEALGSPELLHRLTLPTPATPPEGSPALASRQLPDEGRGPVADPFGPTPDPTRDAPRTELARVVEALHADLSAGRPATVITGPPGAGKTLALRLLARRLEPTARVVALPYPALAPDEALAWLADLAGAPAGPDGETRLVAALAGPCAGGLVVLLDEAPALPEATRLRLLAFAGAHEPLQLTLAGCVLEHGARSAWRPEPELPRHRLGGTLTLEEARALLRGRLADDADPLLAPASVQALHEAARGSPALLLRRADEAWRRAGRPAPPGSGGSAPGGASSLSEASESPGQGSPSANEASPPSGSEAGGAHSATPSDPGTESIASATRAPSDHGPSPAPPVRSRPAPPESRLRRRPAEADPGRAHASDRRGRRAGPGWRGAFALLALLLLLASTALLFAPRVLGRGGNELSASGALPAVSAARAVDGGSAAAPVPVRFAAPPQVQLLVNGRELARGLPPEPVLLAPGTHRVEAHWPGGGVAERSLRVEPLPAGAVLEVRAPGVGGAAAAAPDGAPTAARPAAELRGTGDARERAGD